MSRRTPVVRAVRRAAPSAAAAVAAFAVCLAGSVFQHARLVAHVDGTSVWTALHRRWRIVVTSWQSSTTTADWLLFGGTATLAAAAVAARPVLGRLASARRRTE